MATVIDTPEAANRLARAIASDLSLYNEAKIKEGIENDTFFTVLAEEIEEVRARVEPGIYPALVVRAALLDLLGEHGEEGVVLDPFLDLRLVVEREVGGDGARQPVGRLGRVDHGRHG